METVQINHHYRPLRIGYAVQFHDKGQLMDAVERATLVAGGMYNPILPVGIEDDLLDQLARTFRIDVVENLTGSDIAFFKDKQQYDWPDFQRENTYINPTSGARVNILDVSHKMQSLYDKPRKAGTDNCGLPTWDADDPRALYLAFTFGKYPQLNKLNYEKAFEHFLETKPTHIDKSGKPEAKMYRRYTPIHLTTEGLTLHSSGFRESRSGYYVGSYDDPIDLVNFWNLRASGHSLTFISLEDESKALVKQLVEDDGIRNPQREGFAAFWFRIELGQDVVGEFAKACVASPYLLPIVGGYWTGGYSSDAVTLSFERDQSILGQIESPYQVKQLVFQKPKPPIYETEQYRPPQVIVSCVKPFGLYGENNRNMLTIPPVPELTGWASYQLTSRTVTVRLKNESIDLVTDTHGGVERMTLVHYDDFFAELFKSRGLDIAKSAPGIIADKLIDHMGGVDSCRIFKVRGVRNMLHGMKVDESISYSTAIQRILDPDATGRNSFDDYTDLHIQARTAKDLSPRECMDYLVSKNLMRAGYELECDSCHLKFWVTLSQMNDHVECHYCYKSVHAAVQVRTRGDIAYRRSGLFGKDNNLEGGVPVVLTLMAVARLGGMHDEPFCTARTIVGKEAGIKCETDIIAVGRSKNNRLDVIIGESKTNMPITRQDVENLLAVKAQLDDDSLTTYICFTKLSPFTPEEIALFKEMDSHGACPILFNEKELVPYFLYYNFDDSELAQKHAFDCGELVENSRKIHLS